MARIAKLCDSETDPISLDYFKRAYAHLYLLSNVTSNRAYQQAFDEAGRLVLRGLKLLGERT